MPDTRAMNEALRRAREMQSRAEPPPKQEPEPCPAPQEAPPELPQNTNTAPLDTLLRDKERMLLLALLLLLHSEGGSTELLFALMYLLI